VVSPDSSHRGTAVAKRPPLGILRAKIVWRDRKPHSRVPVLRTMRNPPERNPDLRLKYSPRR
jgi:hypothetical protein